MALDSDTAAPMLIQAKKLKQYLAAISVSLGTLCAGNCLAWSSPALAQLKKGLDFPFSNQEAAAVGSMIAIGGLIAAIPAGFLADKFGRKKIILVTSLAFLINWLLIIFAQNSTMLIVGRIFGGLGTGGICAVGAMYIGEIADSTRRGVLTSFINMFLCIGILLSDVFGSFTSWRVLSAVLAIFPIIFGVSMFFMPETPVYLVKMKKIEEAEKTLVVLRGNSYDVQAELKEIQQEVETSQKNSAKLKDIFTSRANLRSFISVVPVLAFQQLCGINAVIFYTVPIFQATGSTLSPELASIIIALVQVISSYISLFIVEKANRKFYLMLSSIGMMLFLTTLAMYFHLKKLNLDISNLSFLPITGAVLFIVFFSIGYGPVPWMLLGELLAPEVKGIVSGFAIATNWTCAFFVTYFFPILESGIGSHVSFYICAGIMAFATVYVGFVVPETRGTTLLEIQQILNN